MKKTVVYEFPDDFEFPKYVGEKNVERKEKTGSTIKTSACCNCPFCASDDDGFWCSITGYEYARGECPFYGGADSVNYEDY